MGSLEHFERGRTGFSKFQLPLGALYEKTAAQSVQDAGFVVDEQDMRRHDMPGCQFSGSRIWNVVP